MKLLSAIAMWMMFAGFLPPARAADHPEISIPNSCIHSFHSAVNGTDYELFIILPKSYTTSPQRRYPVFYLLDGNDTAAIAYYTRGRQHSDEAEPIFVGIGYPEPLAGPPVPLPGKPAVPPAQRSADYATVTTSEPWSPPADKGAPVFLKVIQKEIIPYIDSQYRTDPGDRALGGHSLGGQFTTYALFHADHTFQKFWIGSPNLLWDHSARFKDEAQFAATHHELKARVFADVGGQESQTFMRNPLFQLMNKVKSRHYPHLVWKTVVLPNEDHGTLPVAGMPQTLDFLYGPPVVELTPAQSRLILGDWFVPGGNVIHIRYDNDLLVATGLPFLSNTDPAKEQLISPLGPDHFLLRTMLTLDLAKDASGNSELVIGKTHSTDHVRALREGGHISH